LEQVLNKMVLRINDYKHGKSKDFRDTLIRTYYEIGKFIGVEPRDLQKYQRKYNIGSLIDLGEDSSKLGEKLK